jgi:hypothetical protein
MYWLDELWRTVLAMLNSLAGFPIWAWTALVAVIALAVGGISLFKREAALSRELRFAGDFREHFIAYAKSRGIDRQAYHWMTRNSVKMQAQMGFHGIVSAFRDPPHTYSDYPIILNMLPRIRSDLDDPVRLTFSHTGELVQIFDEVLVRYLGHLDENRNHTKIQLRNPAHWFLDGITQILSVPLHFFSAFGVISAATISALQQSWLFRFASAVVVFIGLVASIISIINDGGKALVHVRTMLGF